MTDSFKAVVDTLKIKIVEIFFVILSSGIVTSGKVKFQVEKDRYIHILFIDIGIGGKNHFHYDLVLK